MNLKMNFIKYLKLVYSPIANVIKKARLSLLSVILFLTLLVSQIDSRHTDNQYRDELRAKDSLILEKYNNNEIFKRLKLKELDSLITIALINEEQMIENHRMILKNQGLIIKNQERLLSKFINEGTK